jgi:hypothetical protein
MEFYEKSFGIIAFDPWSNKSIVYPKRDEKIIPILDCNPESVVMVEVMFVGDKTKHRFYTNKERAEEYLMDISLMNFLKSCEIFAN